MKPMSKTQQSEHEAIKAALDAFADEEQTSVIREDVCERDECSLCTDGAMEVSIALTEEQAAAFAGILG